LLAQKLTGRGESRLGLTLGVMLVPGLACGLVVEFIGAGSGLVAGPVFGAPSRSRSASDSTSPAGAI
jgi:hypothetical protein